MLTNEINKIIEKLIAIGGQCYLVGGVVRDSYLQKDVTDIDIEVFNLDLEQIVSILENDYQIKIFENYGCIKIDSLNLDINLPKIELKVNQDVDHYGIKYIIDKDLTLEEAMKRRDISINAIYYDLNNNQLVDLVGGIDDLQKHRCRIINKNFEQDPDRFYRLIYYSLKYSLIIDNTTIERLKTMNYKNISRKKKRMYIDKISAEYKKSK